jgi:hypothetical protein
MGDRKRACLDGCMRDTAQVRKDVVCSGRSTYARQVNRSSRAQGWGFGLYDDKKGCIAYGVGNEIMKQHIRWV